MNIPVATLCMLLAVLAYAVLQIIMLVRTSGAMRMAAMIPLAVMLPAMVMTAVASERGIASAPELLILLTPLSALYFLALTTLRTTLTTGRLTVSGRKAAQ